MLLQSSPGAYDITQRSKYIFHNDVLFYNSIYNVACWSKFIFDINILKRLKKIKVKKN